MQRSLLKFIGSFRSGILLVAVYALHMLFYEALMAMPAKQFSNHFSIVYGQKKGTTGKNNPSKCEYRVLLKHEDEKSPSPYTEPQAFDEIVVKAVLFPSANCDFDLKPLSSFQLPDDAYKLYRLLRVFLI